MATLGNQDTGFTFSVSGSFGQAAGGNYTVPSPGIFVTDINVYADNNGSTSTDRLLVWADTGGGHAGSWLVRSGTFSMDSGRKWRTRSDLSPNTGQISSDGYIPAGTKIWIGVNAGDGSLTYEGNGSGSSTDIGDTGGGNFNFHDTAGGVGKLAAYIHYTKLSAPTVSSASPTVGKAGDVVTVTGTNLLHTSGATVNGAAASFTVTDDTHVSVTIPSGATPGTGTIVLTTPAGSDSTAFTVGTLYADNLSAFVGGVVAYGDDGAAWQQAQVWADTGTAWVQIG